MSELKVNCPTCSKEVIWNKESQYRPFCSERCRLIDLGEWANEEKRIAGIEHDVFSKDLEDNSYC